MPANVRAQVVADGAEPALRGALARLCQLADMPESRLAIAETPEPLALAVRHPRGGATICLDGSPWTCSSLPMSKRRSPTSGRTWPTETRR